MTTQTLEKPALHGLRTSEYFMIALALGGMSDDTPELDDTKRVVHHVLNNQIAKVKPVPPLSAEDIETATDFGIIPDSNGAPHMLREPRDMEEMMDYNALACRVQIVEDAAVELEEAKEDATVITADYFSLISDALQHYARSGRAENADVEVILFFDEHPLDSMPDAGSRSF